MSTYVITKFDEAAGQIIVRFDASVPPIAVDLPIENGLYPTGEALDTYVKGFIPTWHVERLNTIKAGVSNASEIAALVVPEAEQTFFAQEQADAQAMQEEQLASDKAFIVDVINEVLAAKGL
jgi:hypothetical protein